jgi:hypothetical protein
MSSKMIDLYAIHDAWFYTMNDGDVDDRAAIKFYEKLIRENPSMNIMVYFTDNRFDISKPYYLNSNIKFQEKFNISDVMNSKKVGVFSKIKDSTIRDELTSVLLEKKNGYCQGDKIGCYNFPDDSYKPLLDAMTYKFSTEYTNITFPVSFMDNLDSQYKNDYLAYGFLKLIAIGGIINIPSLVYRLYCPKIGGGPGTNILKIQKWFMDYTYLDINSQPNSFEDVNKLIINEYTKKNGSDLLDNFTPLKDFIVKATQVKQVKINDVMVDINLEALENSLKVMIIFGNLIYKPKTSNKLFDSDTKQFYTLSGIPEGNLLCESDETPPLYDLVAAYSIMFNSFPLEDNQTQKDKDNIKDEIIQFFSKKTIDHNLYNYDNCNNNLYTIVTFVFITLFVVAFIMTC